MVDVIQALFNSVQGQQVSAVFVLAVIIIITGTLCYYMYKFMKFSLLNAPDYMKKNRKVSSDVEWLKTVEGTKYIDEMISTKIKLNDDRIIEKISKKIEYDFQLKIFEETKTLYERISKMREEYAGNYVKKHEIDVVIQDLDNVRIQLAKLKGKLNID